MQAAEPGRLDQTAAALSAMMLDALRIGGLVFVAGIGRRFFRRSFLAEVRQKVKRGNSGNSGIVNEALLSAVRMASGENCGRCNDARAFLCYRSVVLSVNISREASSMLMRIHVLLLSVLLAAPAASAAEVIPLKSKLCHLQLDGLIQDGDFEKVKAAHAKAQDEIEKRNTDPKSKPPSLTPEDYKVVFCLNSPGGSFQEALKIIELFHDESNTVATVVGRGQVCESACALIFMFGTNYEGHSFWSSDRRLHVGGKLGFHTPYVQAIGTKFDARAIEDTYLKGIRAVGRLLEIDRQKFMTRELLSDMLKTEPKDFLYADTIDRAGGWGIELMGYAKPSRLTAAMLEIACDNDQKWRLGWGVLESEDSDVQKPRVGNGGIVMRNRKHRSVLKDFGDESSFDCVVDLYDHKSAGIIMELGLYSKGGDESLPSKDHLERGYKSTDLKRDGIGLLKPLWYTYPSNTKLADIIEGAQ